MGKAVDSKRPVAPEGFERGSIVHAPVDGQADGRESWEGEVKRGLFWAAFGGMIAFAAPNIGSVIAAYGICLACFERAGSLLWKALLACLGAGALTAALVDLTQVPLVILTCVATIAVALLVMGNKATSGCLCALALALAAATGGVEALYAWIGGTTLPQAITDLLAASGEMLSKGANISAQVGVDRAVALARTYWPMAYLSGAAVRVALALFGARLALRKRGVVFEKSALMEFDAPLWVCAAFVVGMAASMSAPLFPEWSYWIKFFGENVLTAARIALSIQGIAVGLWYARQWGVGPFMRGMLVALMVWIEVSFVVMSVLGLVDALLANFRSLERRRWGFATRSHE